MKAFNLALRLGAQFCLLSIPAFGQSEDLPKPEVAEISFDTEEGGRAVGTTAGNQKADFITTMGLNGGSVISAEMGFQWTIADSANYGVGSLRIGLDRSKVSGDLALVVDASLAETSSVAIQLHDTSGDALAIDLFGEIKFNADAVRTNTFIVPLRRYPDAASITFRRLSGSVAINRILLFPVLGEIQTSRETEQTLALKLGETLSEHHKFGKNADLPALEPGILHLVPALEKINSVGAEALSAIGFPKYSRIATGPLPVEKISASGTTYDFAHLAGRFLSINGDQKTYDIFFTSSNGVFWYFLNEDDSPRNQQFGLASMPMSTEERAKFEKKSGFPILEIPIARSAIEVLVNSENPLSELTIPQLDAAFGKELRAGASARAITWQDFQVKSPELRDKAIKTVGGDPSWGTGKTFQQLVLKGGAWRDDIDVPHDVVHHQGVESVVGQNPAGIGYVALHPLRGDSKSLAISRGLGEPAYRATTANIYSGQYPLQRKLYALVAAPSLMKASPSVIEMVNLLLSDVGQTMIARSNSLPLPALEIIGLRTKLGLPNP